MADDPAVLDVGAALAETVDFLTLRRDGDGWVGDAPDWFGEYLFGGFVIAQAIVGRDAGCTRRPAAPLDARVLSAPVTSAGPIAYRVRTLREGRSFTTRHVEASTVRQAGARHDVLVHRRRRPRRVSSTTCRARPRCPAARRRSSPRAAPVRGSRAGSARPRPRPTAPASRRTACGSASRLELPDDPHLHTALLGFATDWTGIGGRPLHLEGDIAGHGEPRPRGLVPPPGHADEWLFYDVHSLVNAGGRGLLRGVMRDATGASSSRSRRRCGSRRSSSSRADAAPSGRARSSGPRPRCRRPSAR